MEKNKSKIKRVSILTIDHLGLINEELFYMKKGYLPKKLSKDWLRDMIEFVPIYVKSKEGRILLEEPINKEQIKKSKEIKQFINSSTSTNNNYEKYISTAEESFGRINNVFKIDEVFYKKLNRANGKIVFNKKNKERLVNYFWINIKNKMFYDLLWFWRKKLMKKTRVKRHTIPALYTPLKTEYSLNV